LAVNRWDTQTARCVLFGAVTPASRRALVRSEHLRAVQAHQRPLLVELARTRGAELETLGREIDRHIQRLAAGAEMYVVFPLDALVLVRSTGALDSALTTRAQPFPSFSDVERLVHEHAAFGEDGPRPVYGYLSADRQRNLPGNHSDSGWASARLSRVLRPRTTFRFSPWSERRPMLSRPLMGVLFWKASAAYRFAAVPMMEASILSLGFAEPRSLAAFVERVPRANSIDDLSDWLPEIHVHDGLPLSDVEELLLPRARCPATGRAWLRAAGWLSSEHNFSQT